MDNLLFIIAESGELVAGCAMPSDEANPERIYRTVYFLRTSLVTKLYTGVSRVSHQPRFFVTWFWGTFERAQAATCDKCSSGSAAAATTQAPMQRVRGAAVARVVDCSVGLAVDSAWTYPGGWPALVHVPYCVGSVPTVGLRHLRPMGASILASCI